MPRRVADATPSSTDQVLVITWRDRNGKFGRVNDDDKQGKTISGLNIQGRLARYSAWAKSWNIVTLLLEDKIFVSAEYFVNLLHGTFWQE